ncbi:MAG TPA: hypothetical protein VN844_22460 [Pyrinomonadaceae bacterium]|nr:hypothetical protein [Pyrinomonadaceae bacterium]
MTRLTFETVFLIRMREAGIINSCLCGGFKGRKEAQKAQMAF